MTISPTGQEDALRLRPMIPSGIRIDAGSPAEFSCGHHQDVIQESPVGQILNQGPDGPVMPGQLVPKRPFDIAVVIPVTSIK